MGGRVGGDCRGGEGEEDEGGKEGREGPRVYL